MFTYEHVLTNNIGFVSEVEHVEASQVTGPPCQSLRATKPPTQLQLILSVNESQVFETHRIETPIRLHIVHIVSKHILFDLSLNRCR